MTACEEVGEDFHPRYDAAAKRYRYRWYQSAVRDPFREGLAVQLPRPVDTAAMNEAAGRLLGTHNFSAFCASGGKIPPEERVRTLTECAVTQTGDEIHLTVTGDGFLYHMVRMGCRPAKIFRLACYAFAGEYDAETILSWLCMFVRRFFAQQFKRTCLPDGPKVGSVTLSPRGDWRMPSDACNTLWMAELEKLEV